MLNLGNISQRNFSGLSGEVFTIEDNRKNAKKPLTELAWFKKNYDVIIANPDALKQANENFIERVPVDEIHVNRELFQNRKKAYSSDSTNRIIEAVENGTFNIKVFDPVLLWRSDEDGLLYVLSGHSRTEAFRQLAKTNPNFSTIPAKILDVSKETAIEIALNSNTLSTRESDSERAYYYHYLMNNMGKDKKEVKEKCYSQEGANASRIWKMSFLNPNGKAIDSLDSLESGDQQSRAKMQAIVAWLGAARLRRPVLTTEHENELYVW